ncbi:MAG: hypothetical protein LC660_18560 [Desulfobacteraceae bacterium]|nr:hypothetical protein [Desulfobacteraceae bacterium]
MDIVKKRTRFFPSAAEDAQSSKLHADTPQTQSPSYALSFLDTDFMMRDELRPVRLQLELLKPEIIQTELNIESTVVIYGSARFKDSKTAKIYLDHIEDEAQNNPDAPDIAGKLKIARKDLENSRYYDEARKLGRLIASAGPDANGVQCVVSTGGGPGIMEAAGKSADCISRRVRHHGRTF